MAALIVSFLRQHRSLVFSLLALVLLSWSAPVNAQDQTNVRAQLDALRLELDGIEAAITSRPMGDSSFQEKRQRVEAIAQSVKTITDEQSPRAEAIRSRLKELGPKPDDKAPPESPDISKEREERERALKEFDDTVKLARTLSVQADQLQTAISDKRRALFTQQLFSQSASVLSPGLWSDIGFNFSHDLRALGIVARDTIERAVDRAGLLGGLLIALGLGLTAFATTLARRHVIAMIERSTRFGNPTRLQRASRAVAMGAIGFVIPFFGIFAIEQAVDGAALLPNRVEPVMVAVLRAAVFISFIGSLAGGILATAKPEWRVLPLGDRQAEKLAALARRIALIIATGRVIESINQAIVAGLGLSVLSKSLIALLVAATLTIGLYRLKPEDRGDAFGDQRPFWIVIARLFGWVMIVGISISAIFGYPVLASFLADQLVTIVILTVLTYIGRQIAEDSFDYLMSPSTKAFRSIQSASGLSRPALEQIAVILSGVLQLLVLGLGVTLALAPWRVDSGDILLPLKAVIFGFTIGEVTISFGAAFFAILLFGAGILLTRGLQRWLTQNYLPRTHLDSGLRNSIVTGIGYAGFIVAAAVSLSGLGLSLEKVTIVAGALSVGIGFGLQSIVNNFVSGLILLWERAIRVGDWVAVGTEEGHVKRINVRATEIETFDRSVLIVPNSSLVSGVVKNRVHNDRTGRVVISIPVSRDADPDLVHRLMSEAAQANGKLLRDPAPNVQYKKLGENVKEFELTGFVAEVDDAGRVSSELLFAIDRALRANGLGEILSRTVMVNEEKSK